MLRGRWAAGEPEDAAPGNRRTWGPGASRWRAPNARALDLGDRSHSTWGWKTATGGTGSSLASSWPVSMKGTASLAHGSGRLLRPAGPPSLATDWRTGLRAGALTVLHMLATEAEVAHINAHAADRASGDPSAMHHVNIVFFPARRSYACCKVRFRSKRSTLRPSMRRRSSSSWRLVTCIRSRMERGCRSRSLRHRSMV